MNTTHNVAKPLCILYCQCRIIMNVGHAIIYDFWFIKLTNWSLKKDEFWVFIGYGVIVDCILCFSFKNLSFNVINSLSPPQILRATNKSTHYYNIRFCILPWLPNIPMHTKTIQNVKYSVNQNHLNVAGSCCDILSMQTM